MLNRFRILIVDDDPAARDLLGVTLAREEWQLAVAQSGEEALALCSAKLPDIALVDIQLPGMSGIEVCRWLKEQQPATFIPVILITSQTELCDKVRGLNGGADEYISKPFSLPELEAQVRALLRIKELTNQLQETQNLLAEREKELLVVEVAGAAAHEMGQPLTSLLLNCEMLQRTLPEDTVSNGIRTRIQADCDRLKLILLHLQQVESYQTKCYLPGTKILDLKLAPDRR